MFGLLLSINYLFDAWDKCGIGIGGLVGITMEDLSVVGYFETVQVMKISQSVSAWVHAFT